MVLQNVNDLHLRNSSSFFSPSYIQSNCLFLDFHSPPPVLQGNNPLEPPKSIRSRVPKNLLSLNVIGFAAFVGVPLCCLCPLVPVCVYVSVTPARGADAFSWDGRLQGEPVEASVQKRISDCLKTITFFRTPDLTGAVCSW